MRTCTQRCREYGHSEFSVQCGDTGALPSALEWLLSWLESEVASGTRFLPEQTVQMGWSLLEVRQRTDGTLALFEPDFQNMPIRFVDDVSNTLLHLFLQKSAAQSLELFDELTLPSLLESAIICTAFGSTEGFGMSRTDPEGVHSGWFFGCDDPTHDHQTHENLRCISLYEAAVFKDDRIVPFLALPPDTYVGFGHGAPYFSRGGKELGIVIGSYLHAKYCRES